MEPCFTYLTTLLNVAPSTVRVEKMLRSLFGVYAAHQPYKPSAPKPTATKSRSHQPLRTAQSGEAWREPNSTPN